MWDLQTRGFHPLVMALQQQVYIECMSSEPYCSLTVRSSTVMVGRWRLQVHHRCEGHILDSHAKIVWHHGSADADVRCSEHY
jgi:hypothetical protein